MIRLLPAISLALACLIPAGRAVANPLYSLEIRGMTVARDGQVRIDYALRNQGKAPVCLPSAPDAPDVRIEPFRARDNTALSRAAGAAADPEDWFRSPYRALQPGRSLNGTARFSVYDFPQPVPQLGQAIRAPRLWRDHLYVILALPVRNCPLLSLASRIGFNRSFTQDPVVRSLPSSVFSLSRPGRY